MRASLRGADAVLDPGAAAVPQFEVGELTARAAGAGVGGEGGVRCPSESVNRNCAPGCGRSLRTITRMPVGHPDWVRC